MGAVLHFSTESINPYVAKSPQDELQIDLLLKGVKCGHCVHKITKQIEQGALSRWQFGAQGSRLSLWAESREALIAAIEEIDQLGFGVIPLNQDTKRLETQKHFKTELKRLAVAGVCAGNIMLFSTAVYLGASPDFTHFFHKLSFALIIPVIFYSAVPIWSGFFKSLKNQKFNLDFPIGLALATGLLLSVMSFFGDQNHVYFDSLAMVVFVILVSRFILGRYVDSLMLKSGFHVVPGVFQIRKIVEEGHELLPPNRIKKGDRILVKKGEVIPVDGKLISSEAILDNAVITGESEPTVAKPMDFIFAGGKLCAGEIVIEVSQVGEETRVGRYLTGSQKNQAKHDDEAYEKVNFFTTFVILVSALTFFAVWEFIGFEEAYERAFAIILVACPCAISFGIPLIRSLTGKLAVDHGLAIKDTGVLKKISSIENIFLDKTGTLTSGNVEICKEDLKVFTEEDLEKIVSLESQMDHPIGRGIIRASGIINPMRSVKDFQYIAGKGIRGEVDGDLFEVYSTHGEQGQKRIQVLKNLEPLGVVRIESSMKKGLQSFFKELSVRFKSISILSGDQKEQVDKIWKHVPKSSRGVLLSEATPEQKRDVVIENYSNSLMVGDGINDLSSMEKAGLSLCMPGALEDNLQVADITLVKGDLLSILNVFKLSEKVLNVERNLMIFTFLYNVICIGLAVIGWITPLAAVILMPISSLCVLGLVALSLRRL